MKKRKNILELVNPKILQTRQQESNTTYTKRNIIENSVATEKNVEHSIKNKKYKEEKNSYTYTEQEEKLSKGKNRKKNKNYSEFDNINKQNTNSILNLDETDENKPKKRYVAGKKNKNRFSNSLNIEENNSAIEVPTEIVIDGPMAIKQLAIKLNKPETELIKILFLKGVAVTINEVIDIPTIELIINYFEIPITLKSKENKLDNLFLPSSFNIQQENLEKRAPIVAILGHVDHGKTSLLDQIRSVQTVKEEAGGITQGLKAYNVIVNVNNKQEKIVFLDTPGHAAFSQMRSRGALVMDIAILVVAADDKIQPQTVESIKYIQAAKVPFVVAINKIDKDTSNVEKIKEELAQYNIISEDWGGDTIFVPISALNGTNISLLLDSILVVAELQNLQASFKGKGYGIIIEAQMDKNKGIAAIVLIRNGIFTIGDVVATDNMIGKIRIMSDEKNLSLEEAGPSQVISLWGFTEIPEIGKEIKVYASEKEARTNLKKDTSPITSRMISSASSSLEYNLQKEAKVLNILIKSSTQGSLEAVLEIINQIPQKKVRIKILSAAAGEITETDILYASTTQAKVIGFDTTLAPGARNAATRLEVAILEYKVIYELVDNLKEEMCKLLDPEFVKQEMGQATVRNIFTLTKGKVAGCYVDSGKLQQNSLIEVVRNNNKIYEGNLDSLKRIKEDVKEITLGNECGILIKDFQDWEKQDIIKAFELTPKEPSLV